MPGEHALPPELMAGMPIEQRFIELGIRVADRLEDVRDSIEKDRSKAAAEVMPWLHKMRPDRMVIELEQRLHLNERIIAFLLKEIGVHMALSAKIESDLKQSRNKALMESMKVPEGIQNFMLKLHGEGLLASSVKDMSKGSIQALVSMLNGEADPDLTAALGIGKGSRRVSDEDADRAIEETRRILDEHASMPVMEIVEPVAKPIVPVVPTAFDGVWDYDVGPLPPEYWSTVQEMEIPYRWEYRTARPDEEIPVLDMMLPEAHDWLALWNWNRHFKKLTLERMRSRRGGIKNIRDLIAIEKGIAFEDVDMNVVRTWLLLLVGRLMTAEECDSMFEPRFFEGLVMPCPATGGTVVRELVMKEV